MSKKMVEANKKEWAVAVADENENDDSGRGKSN